MARLEECGWAIDAGAMRDARLAAAQSAALALPAALSGLQAVVRAGASYNCFTRS